MTGSASPLPEEVSSVRVPTAYAHPDPGSSCASGRPVDDFGLRDSGIVRVQPLAQADSDAAPAREHAPVARGADGGS